MQLGSIKKEFGLKELNTIELGPIYKNLDGIPVEIFVSMQSIESIDRKNKTTKSTLGARVCKMANIKKSSSLESDLCLMPNISSSTPA
jgi:hypothetical protein